APYTFAVSRFMSSLVKLASSFGWPMEEIDYRISEIEFLKQNFSSQHPVIANRQIALGNMLPTWGKHRQAISLMREAAAQIEGIETPGLSEQDRLRLQNWQEKVQNNLGWLLIIDGQYSESVAVLNKVLQSRE